MKDDAKIIFSPQLANFLLKRGFKIIKLKPKHGMPNETVFVFKVEMGMGECIEDWMDANPNR